MSPQPSELKRGGSLPELTEIIKPIGGLIPSLEKWIKASGEKVQGTPHLIGFVLDTTCVHPIVQIEAHQKRGFFVLGGEDCHDLFLITHISSRNHRFFSVDWGGTSQKQIYRVTSEGFTLIEDGNLGLVQGDGTGRIPTKGAVLFSRTPIPQSLGDKVANLFPYSNDKRSCTFALWSGLQRAAGL